MKRRKNDTFQIMNHTGYGELKIITDEYEIIIPQEFITKEGKIYERIKEKLKRNDTLFFEKNNITLKKKS